MVEDIRGSGSGSFSFPSLFRFYVFLPFDLLRFRLHFSHSGQYEALRQLADVVVGNVIVVVIVALTRFHGG